MTPDQAAAVELAQEVLVRPDPRLSEVSPEWLHDAKALATALLAREEEIERLREGLSWSLDVLELSLKRLDTIEAPSAQHLEIRAAGLAKARAALQTPDEAGEG